MLKRNPIAQILVLPLLVCLALAGCASQAPGEASSGTGYELADPTVDMRVGDEDHFVENSIKYEEIQQTALLLVTSGGSGSDENGSCVSISGYAVMENGDVNAVNFVSHADHQYDKSYVSVITTLNDSDVERVKSFVNDKGILTNDFEQEAAKSGWWGLYANDGDTHVALSNSVDISKEASAFIKEIVGIKG